MEEKESWFDVYSRSTSAIQPYKGGGKRALEKQHDDKYLAKREKAQLELELGVPKTLRAEFNFLKFPFFDLARNSSQEKIKIEGQEERRNRKKGGKSPSMFKKIRS